MDYIIMTIDCTKWNDFIVQWFQKNKVIVLKSWHYQLHWTGRNGLLGAAKVIQVLLKKKKKARYLEEEIKLTAVQQLQHNFSLI